MRVRVREVFGAASVQDAGRPGFRKYGVPPGGAFDRGALAAVNDQLENRSDDPALELAGAVLELEALDGGCLAWSGAPCPVRRNGELVSRSVPLLVDPGDVLRFEPPTTGLRVYVGLCGGVDAPVALGSRSGWTISKGEVLRSLSDRALVAPWRAPKIDDYAIKGLRIAPGPQADRFDLDTFTSEPYVVTPMIDRVGIRLEGSPLGESPEIVSEPAFVGSIQVARSGQPIILGPDGPTIGGYPKIAQVLDEDMDAVAQLRPGVEVRFLWV